MAPRAPSILVTGAGGFVGRRLAPRLAQWAGPGARLVALGRDAAAPQGFEARCADVADEAAVDAIVADVRPNVIVHLAAQSSVGAAHGAAAATWRTNCGGALALATACARHAPQALVLAASSAEVYGATFNDGPVAEDAPLRPQNAYARSKAAAEQVFSDVLAATNTLIVARPFNHSGAGQDERFVLPSFAAQIARIEAGLQEPVMHVGNLDAERDFLHVDDVCDAYVALLAAGERLGARAVFNICSGAAQPIGALLTLMRERATIPFEIRVDPNRMRPSDIPRAAGRGERLHEAVGFAPGSNLARLVEDILFEKREQIRRSG